MALVKPTLTFELGLLAGINDPIASIAWEDITAYVQSWSTSRGRQPKRPPAHFDPGTASLVLDNRGRRFDPTNTAGPYYPNLKPAKVRLRITATWLGVPYAVITGYVKRWPPEWTDSATSTVKIDVVDALGAPLNLATLQASIWQTMVQHDKPKAFWRLGEGSGTTGYDSTSHRLDGTYQGSPTLSQPGLVLNSDGDKAAAFPSASRLSLPYKNLITGYPWTFECWFLANSDRAASRMLFSAYTGAVLGFSQAVEFFIVSSVDATRVGKLLCLVANPFPSSGIQCYSSVDVDDGFHHHLVVVMASSSSMKIWIDGVDRTIVDLATAHTFPDDLNTGYAIGNNPSSPYGDYAWSATNGGSIDEVAVYDYALPDARIIQHYQGAAYPTGFGEPSGAFIGRLLAEADWPAADYAPSGPGASRMQPLTSAGSVVANLQRVEDSEQGGLFVDESGRLVFHDRYVLLHPPYDTSQVTLGQGAADLPYEAPVTWGNDDTELYNQVSGSRAGGRSFVIDDDASQDEYRVRALSPLDGLLNVSDLELADLLTYRAKRYAQPMSSVRRVRLHPAAVPALYPYVLGLGLRSRITVKVQPPGGGPVFSQESHIERITHEVDDMGDWWTTWDISAADTTPYAVTDDLVKGRLDAGNLLAF